MLKENAYEILIKYLETSIKNAEQMILLRSEKNIKIEETWCNEEFSFIHRYYDLYVAMVENGLHNDSYFARMNNIKNAWKIERLER